MGLAQSVAAQRWQEQKIRERMRHTCVYYRRPGRDCQRRPNSPASPPLSLSLFLPTHTQLRVDHHPLLPNLFFHSSTLLLSLSYTHSLTPERTKRGNRVSCTLLAKKEKEGNEKKKPPLSRLPSFLFFSLLFKQLQAVGKRRRGQQPTNNKTTSSY